MDKYSRGRERPGDQGFRFWEFFILKLAYLFAEIELSIDEAEIVEKPTLPGPLLISLQSASLCETVASGESFFSPLSAGAMARTRTGEGDCRWAGAPLPNRRGSGLRRRGIRGGSATAGEVESGHMCHLCGAR